MKCSRVPLLVVLLAALAGASCQHSDEPGRKAARGALWMATEAVSALLSSEDENGIQTQIELGLEDDEDD